ncbi:hypothetical protein KBY97_03855 [Synechococcus sp. ATX 2A4]|uniref:hypothetical protein n=1 Tax=Synechococcus sp. ATX 2A4 TaxID=2823727 RepID=UPI0020CDB77F|nr:hypothetical protein [Synechococcus sp. ATX 2A4]MCP9884263.1 hypothetical protein [Synechococcus sp. ATX 2A4]
MPASPLSWIAVAGWVALAGSQPLVAAGLIALIVALSWRPQADDLRTVWPLAEQRRHLEGCWQLPLNASAGLRSTHWAQP